MSRKPLDFDCEVWLEGLTPTLEETAPHPCEVCREAIPPGDKCYKPPFPRPQQYLCHTCYKALLSKWKKYVKTALDRVALYS